MKITINISEEFDGGNATAAAFDFAARLRVMLALPAEAFEALARAIPASANSNSATIPSVAEKPATGSHAPPSPPVAGNLSPSAAGSVAEAASTEEITVTGETATPATVTPPVDTAPRAKRGRPSNTERAINAPKAKSAGASGVAAEVIAPPAAETINPINQAISAGLNESEQLQHFQRRILPYLKSDHHGAYQETLKSFGVKSGRDVPAQERDKFMAALQAKAGVALAPIAA